MTPAEEAHFIQLWQAGAEQAAIAQQLGIPVGTAAASFGTHSLRNTSAGI